MPSEPPRPTDAELEILTVLWSLGAATVREVHDSIARRRAVEYATVLKFMQIMAEKGLVRRDDTQRAHIYEAARTRVLLGTACRHLGDDDAAALELDAARAIFEELGARPDLARVESLMASARSKAAYGLSPRELEVLRHVAVGKTNKEIATELVLSDRTIDRHVSNIFAKLGVSTRAAATAFAHEHQLV